jgi:hypothetical protein
VPRPVASGLAFPTGRSCPHVPQAPRSPRRLRGAGPGRPGRSGCGGGRDPAAVSRLDGGVQRAGRGRGLRSLCDLAYALPEVAQGTRATICGNFARLFARPGLTLRYDPPLIHEILIEGNLAVVRLRWTLTTEADGLRETGVEEGMDVLRRQSDGRWAIARFVAFTPEAE